MVDVLATCIPSFFPNAELYRSEKREINLKNFSLLVNGLTTDELEHVLAIQKKSQDKVRFMPQAVGGQQGVSTVIQNVGNPPKQVVVYNNVRIEWTDDALEFAHELLGLFVHEKTKQAGAGH